MYKTRQALIDHLKTADENSDPAVPAAYQAATIKKYASEFSRGDGRKAVRLRMDLPAILVVFDIGRPLVHVPDHSMSLLFVTDNKHLDRDEAEKDALLVAGSYLQWLLENHEFEDQESYYEIIDPENTRLEALLYDQKYTVLGAQLTISVDRQV